MPTRLQLITRAEVRANMDRSGFPTAAQKIELLNEQAGSLWAEMVNQNYPARRTTVDLAAVSGTASYPLGDELDLLRVVAVWDYRLYGGQTQPTWVRRANSLERGVSALQLGYQPSRVLYDLEVDPLTGPSLLLLPNSVSGAFRVELYEAYPGLSSDSSVWYGPAPSDEVLVLRTAAAMLDKLNPDSARHLRSEASQRAGELWQVCQSMAAPQRVQDHTSEAEGWCYDDL